MRLSKWVGLAVVAAALTTGNQKADAGFQVILSLFDSNTNTQIGVSTVVNSAADSGSISMAPIVLGDYSVNGSVIVNPSALAVGIQTALSINKTGSAAQYLTVKSIWTSDGAGTVATLNPPSGSTGVLSSSGGVSSPRNLNSGATPPETVSFQVTSDGTVLSGAITALTSAGGTFSNNLNLAPGAVPNGPFNMSQTQTIKLAGPVQIFGTTQTSTLVVSAVPEPATIGSLLAILPAIGLIALRRRTRAQA